FRSMRRSPSRPAFTPATTPNWPAATPAMSSPPAFATFGDFKDALSSGTADGAVGAGGIDGNRRVHSDRKQWLDRLDHVAAIQTELRAQQADDRERRALRLRFRL